MLAPAAGRPQPNRTRARILRESPLGICPGTQEVKRKVWLVRVNLASRSGIVLAAFAVLALILYLLSVLLSLPSEAHILVQAVAEALVVSIVVALAVEPRLLRHFGEELASQTFWTSFYSRGLGSFGTDISDCGAALADRGPIRIGDVGVMGQAILLYWARYQPAAALATAARPEASAARPESELCHRLAAGQAHEAGTSQGASHEAGTSQGASERL
jgi:hypothetical protein